MKTEIESLLRTLNFYENPEKPGLYSRRLEAPDACGKIGVTAFIDFRRASEKGRRFYTVDGIDGFMDQGQDVNLIPVLQYFKTERDKILGASDLPAKNELRKDSIITTSEVSKAKNFLENRGKTYRVRGNERPDAHRIQNVANERGISIEIIESVQTADYARVVVRGRIGDQFVDAVVHHDFATEYQLKTMEIIEKNRDILDHYDGVIPVIKDGATIKTDNKIIDAKYYLVHALLSFKKFSLRDARTKAAAIAQAMLLNREWREDDEILNEIYEKEIIEKSTKK